MSAFAVLLCSFSLALGQVKPPVAPSPGAPSASANPPSPGRSAADAPPKVEKPFITPEISQRYVSPDEGPQELVAPCKEIHDKRVRLVPEVRIESVPQYIPGKAEFGTTRQDVQIHYREEKQTITTLKLRTVERRIQVLSRRTILKGEVDPTTGEAACDCRQVTVPVTVTMNCQVLEPVTEEIIVRVPEVKTIESPILVRRFGLLAGEKAQIAKRYRAVLFNDPIAVPPCVEDLSPRDPLGRPESPEGIGNPSRRALPGPSPLALPGPSSLALPGPSSDLPQPLPNQVLPKPIRGNREEGQASPLPLPSETQSLPKPR